MNKTFILIVLCLVLSACSVVSPKPQVITTVTAPTLTPGPTPTLSPQESKIPAFDHVIMVFFENKDFDQVIGNKDMPVFNKLAEENVLLTQYYAVAHPSLPNYIALIGGDTFGINTSCKTCFINHASLPDEIEASGRTWKTYQEDLPSPCFMGDAGKYAQKHNPFVYFDPIRKDTERCKKSVVSLKALDQDLASNNLPNYAFIMPNLCNASHDCSMQTADQWLGNLMKKFQGSKALGQNYLIYVAFEEGHKDNSSCCGLPESAGGRVPAILISPEAVRGYRVETPLTHYSMLKTILTAWKLPDLGYTAMASTAPITSPWK